MKYKIALHHSEEGYSVSVPGLPGCWSQGASEEEALQNIQAAIQEYLAARVVMTDGLRILTIPRHNPINAYTMGGIVRDAGLTEEQFRSLL